MTRWIYGSSGVSHGVVDNGHYFTLLKYSQVLGLDARLAGPVGTAAIAASVLIFLDLARQPLVSASGTG